MGELTVRFFASARQVAGSVEATLACPEEGLNEDEFWNLLLTDYPSLTALRGTARLARNQEYASPSAVFTPGDEIALIPPVSGG